MTPVVGIAAFFGCLAALFLVLALRTGAREGVNPARRAWIRTGLIFAAVSLYLFIRYGALP